MPPRKARPRKTGKKNPIPGGARKRRGGFPCPDCDFVAKHAMGLGRHRSTRHGVVSKRQQRRRTSTTSAGWVGREQAATRAGVHYNTIRHWEQSGLVRVAKRPGVRGSLVSVADLDRVLAERAVTSGAPVAGSGADAVALAALERRFAQLVEGLESLVAAVKAPRARARRTSASTAPRAAARKTKRPAPKKRAPKKTRANTARKRPAKRAPKKTGRSRAKKTAKARSAKRRR